MVKSKKQNKAIRNAKEYLTPAVIFCDSINSNDRLEFLEAKIKSLNFPLNELKGSLNSELSYFISDDLKEFLNVA